MLIIYLLDLLSLKNFDNNPILKKHLRNAHKLGILSYLKIKNFIHANTDGPENPYSKVYTLKEVKKNMNEFTYVKSQIHFLNKRHIPTSSLWPKYILDKIERKWGWHLWVYMKNKRS